MLRVLIQLLKTDCSRRLWSARATAVVPAAAAAQREGTAMTHAGHAGVRTSGLTRCCDTASSLPSVSRPSAFSPLRRVATGRRAFQSAAGLSGAIIVNTRLACSSLQPQLRHQSSGGSGGAPLHRLTVQTAASKHSSVMAADERNQDTENDDLDLVDDVTEDVEADDGADYFDFEDEDEDFDAAEFDVVSGDDWASSATADASGAFVDTGKQDWGQTGLAIAMRVLADMPHLQLFSLRAIPARRTLTIAIDKLEDKYGSPASDDLESFVREFGRQFEAAVGAELSDTIALEVSSPGAERRVRLPQDLQRFKALPMTVVFVPPPVDGKPGKGEQEKVLMLQSVDEAAGATRWTLADVRFNREAAGKGRRLGKKKLAEVWDLPLSSLLRVNLHLDI